MSFTNPGPGLSHIQSYPTQVPPLPILLISVTGLLAAAVTTPLTALGGDASLSASSSIAQSLISVGVPVVTAVLGASCRGWSPLRVARLLPVVFGYAVIMAAVGVLITTVVTASNGGGWQYAGPVFAGSFVAQSVASLIGFGLGTVIGRPVIAGLMTMIIPLGLQTLLGLDAPATRPSLTSFPNASLWWSDTMIADGQPRFLVMVLLWCVVLNAAGWITQSRRSRNPESARRRRDAVRPFRNNGQPGDIADRAAFRTVPHRWI